MSGVPVVERWEPGKTPDGLRTRQGALGAPMSRLDGPLKTSGTAVFTAETRPEGMCYAFLATSTIAAGRIVALDVDAARRAPGVLLVMTHENAPTLGRPDLFVENPVDGAAFNPVPPLQGDRIDWNGQPIAMVVAETLEQAEYASRLVVAEYAIEDGRTDLDALLHEAEPPDSVLGEPACLAQGDAEAMLDASAYSIDADYRSPRMAHSAIEIHACTVVWRGTQMVLHDASQLIGASRKALVKMFDLEDDALHVVSPFVGGAFGGKVLWDHQILAIAGARALQRPLRMLLSREDVSRFTGGRTETRQRVALGADEEGRLTALIHTGTVANAMHSTWPEQFSFPARHLYASETVKIEQRVVPLHMMPPAPMRAPGEATGTFALESALDELAAKIGIDPIALRKRNEPPRDPSSGLAFSSRRLVEMYDRGAERFGWSQRSAEPGRHRDGRWRIGHGMATAYYPYIRAPGAQVGVVLGVDGCLTLRSSAHEMGMGTVTVQVQHAAERFGLPVSAVAFEYGDSRLPAGPAAGGSAQTVSLLAAVMDAAGKLKDALLRLAGDASPLAGLQADDAEFRAAGLGRVGDDTRFETFAAILARAGMDQIAVEGVGAAPGELEARSMHSYGAQFCEVCVHEGTGETRVTRFVGAFDCGRILNARTAASQFRGGIIMGLGLALMEEVQFDPRYGRIMNPSLGEYHIPVHLDVPEIDVIWSDVPDAFAPLGARGIGEISITGVGAAVANAIYNATGRRIRDLPLTLDKIMR